MKTRSVREPLNPLTIGLLTDQPSLFLEILVHVRGTFAHSRALFIATQGLKRARSLSI